MNHLLQQVGQHMVDVAPPDFAAARLIVTVHEGNVEVLSRFEDENGESSDLPIDILLVAPLWLEIRSHLAKETGREPFEAATFTLANDGHFDLDLRYEDDEPQDEGR